MTRGQSCVLETVSRAVVFRNEGVYYSTPAYVRSCAYTHIFRASLLARTRTGNHLCTLSRTFWALSTMSIYERTQRSLLYVRVVAGLFVHMS
jgi:hypothetical protein